MRNQAQVAELELIDRLGHGERIPFAPGACTCGHAKVWHGHTDRRRPCERCDCPHFDTPAHAADCAGPAGHIGDCLPAATVAELGAAGVARQLDLYGADAGQLFGQLPLFGGAQ